MSLDQVGVVEIDLIIMTDDHEHGHDLRASLTNPRYHYTVTEIADREAMIGEFEAAVEASRGKRPIIVLLDCAFLSGRTESFAARVLELQRSMAIECVVTRPPAELHRRTRLYMLGASLFDSGAPTVEIFPQHRWSA